MREQPLSDAAAITFTVNGSVPRSHVTRDDLLSEVRKLVANKPFAHLAERRTTSW